MQTIHYRITAADPQAHIFAVTMTIAKPTSEGQQLYLPNWIPGSYMIRDFSKHIQWITASCNGEPVALSKTDKSGWQAAACDGPLEVSYEVYAWDLSVRGAHLDQTHGFFNGTSVFLAAKGFEEATHQVQLPRPAGDEYSDWRVATGLEPVNGTKEFEFGNYQAADYGELIDCPVEMADFTLLSFEACGIPHHMALTGRHNADIERLTSDLQKICEHHLQFFGEPLPVKRYIFMTYVLGSGFGGLEHRNSTALHCSRNNLPLATDDTDEVKAGYQTFLDLCSHEYFHTWNVKRIKPAVFLPYDTSQESYTELLWAFEGFTSYYDAIALPRCGVVSIDDYYVLLAKTLTAVRRSDGRHIQSVTDSSFDAWNKYYKQDENSVNAIVSYYTKGALVALCIDLLIRQHTSNEKSLDDVMRLLWQRYGSQGVGVENDTIQGLVAEVAGTPLDAFFQTALYSTDELPLEDCLAHVGLGLEYTARKNPRDRGSFDKDQPSQPEPKSALGIEMVKQGTQIKVKHVYRTSRAAQAGLSVGDVIIAVNDLKVTASDMRARIAEYPVGSKVTLHVFRRDELRVIEVELEARRADTARLFLLDEANGNRDHWLQLES